MMHKHSLYLAGICVIIGTMVIAGVLISSSHKYDTNDSVSDIRNISVTLAGTPEITRTDDVIHVDYTLYLIGFQDAELSLLSVEIVDNFSGDLVRRLEKEALKQAYTPGREDIPSSIRIEFSGDNTQIPNEVIHRIHIVGTGRAMLPFSVSGGVVEISRVQG